ncbi:MAG: hypothetical protein WD425_17420 [Nitrospirales bacterium]
MPYALKLPGVLRAVVPLVGGERFAGFGRSVVHKIIAHAGRRSIGIGHLLTAGHLPRLTTIIRALDNLAEPTT